MRTLRRRLSILAVSIICIAVTAVTLANILFIQNDEHLESNQLLLLLCETGERNLDYYFNRVQRAVETVSSYAEVNITGLDETQLERHVEDVREYFGRMAVKTSGVLTYYYRINPEISESVKGFWYTDIHGQGFEEHEVTDITLYDTEDTSTIVWFTVPKETGKPVWLSPYVTENLDLRVISYNVPIYYHTQFVGVVGIDIDYSTMAEQVESLRLYNNGYAYLNDADGNLFYHPRIEVAQLSGQTAPGLLDGMTGDSTFIRYTFEGVERQAAWLQLSNGMRLTVSVPVSEIEGEWETLVGRILAVAVTVLVFLIIAALLLIRYLTRPVKTLADAAVQVDRGNYDVVLDYTGKDDLGRITGTFRRLLSLVKNNAASRDRRQYVDALTSVKNKDAFVSAMDNLQAKVNDRDNETSFAICVCDCDDLNVVNDRYGREKGDMYLKKACSEICQVFHHSPVFRTGGDEFVVILQNRDFENREELIERIKQAETESSKASGNLWEQIHITMGMAVYEPVKDHSVIDTLHRAEKMLFTNQRKRKDLQG